MLSRNTLERRQSLYPSESNENSTYCANVTFLSLLYNKVFDWYLFDIVINESKHLIFKILQTKHRLY